MKLVRRMTAGFLSVLLMWDLTSGAMAADQADDVFILGVYSTTDMGGKVYDLDPASGKAVDSSYLKVAAAMAAERAENDATLLIDNGDAIQGTSSLLYYNLFLEDGRNNPVGLCLRYCGYDVFVPGEREFNADTTAQNYLYEILSNDTGKYSGTPVNVLCANYLNTKTQEPQMTPYVVKTYSIDEETEFRVGILGFENMGLSRWGIAKRYAKMSFAHGENGASSLAFEWTNYWQQILREQEGCDLVIVAAHSGIGSTSTTETYGFDVENQVAHLIRNTTGIDLVIAGHDCLTGAASISNRDGQEVPVVNGGGSSLTKTQVVVSRDGSFTIRQGELLDLAGYESDAGLKELIAPHYERAKAYAGEAIGTLAGDWDDAAEPLYVGSDTMNLIHEAQLWATEADLSIASPAVCGQLRVSQLLNGEESAPISLEDCYSIYPNGEDTLYMVEMTGLQLRNWLEKCAAAYSVDEGGNLTGGGPDTDQIYGLSYEIYVGNPAGARVANIKYQGEMITDTQVFQVAVNSQRLSADLMNDESGWYAATGITMDSEAVLWDASRSEGFGSRGGSCALILAAYIEDLTRQDKPVVPPASRGQRTISTQDSVSILSPVTRLEFVTALYVYVGSPVVQTGKMCFPDVDQNSGAVAWAVQQGIVQGNEKGEFMPNNAVTREQACVMLERYDATRGLAKDEEWVFNLGSINDYGLASDWAKGSVGWCVSRSYLTTDYGGLFRPQEHLTTHALEEILTLLDGSAARREP